MHAIDAKTQKIEPYPNFLDRRKFQKTVCKRDWHIVRSYLFLNVWKFRTQCAVTLSPWPVQFAPSPKARPRASRSPTEKGGWGLHDRCIGWVFDCLLACVVEMKEWMQCSYLCFTSSRIALAESAHLFRSSVRFQIFYFSSKRLYNIHFTSFDWFLRREGDSAPH